MKIKELLIPGVKMITDVVGQDSRGSLFKPYNVSKMLDLGVEFEVKEAFYSISKKNVIRGMHFQLPPDEQAKIVTVVKGSINDVLLDLRTDSNCFGKFIAIQMTENDGKSIIIPRGIAHGFLGVESQNIVLYLADAEYSKQNEDGIKFDSFGYDWGIVNPILSARDLSFRKFGEFNSPFRMK